MKFKECQYTSCFLCLSSGEGCRQERYMSDANLKALDQYIITDKTQLIGQTIKAIEYTQGVNRQAREVIALESGKVAIRLTPPNTMRGLEPVYATKGILAREIEAPIVTTLKKFLPEEDVSLFTEAVSKFSARPGRVS